MHLLSYRRPRAR